MIEVIRMLGVQIYTLRDYLKDEREICDTAEKLKKMGCDCVQLCHGDQSLEEICRIFSEVGITVIGTLSNLDKLEKNPTLFDTCKKYGLKDIGISSSVITEEEVKAMIPRVNAFAKKVVENGFTFSYHNHANEFTRLPSGKTVMDSFLAGFTEDVTFMPDTFWLQTGGADVREWIAKNSKRITMLHLKDMAVVDRKPTFAEIGQGNMNFVSITEEAKKAGIDTFIIEQDVCLRDPFESVKMSINYLRRISL
ncbi:MAG: sugar phosphate isomerase/epimerase [Ruminococcaceae bacterium]|nr:sugar phosphate isomerase/epimerase [Oscillospiraceae bacterium]